MITLYKRGTHSVLVWSLEQDLKTITVTHGREDGEKQVDVIEHPTYINAVQDRITRVNKKVAREGYSEDYNAPPPGLPMLAHQFREYGDKLPNEVYMQPKYNGYRCVATKHTLLSRKKQPYTSLPHIQEALLKLPSDITLDGELYCHGMSLQDIGGRLRAHEYQPGNENILYYIFDIQIPGIPFRERLELLSEIYYDVLEPQADPTYPLQSVPTRLIHKCAAEITMQESIKQGYEGIILRSPELMYHTDHRSYMMQKYKPLLQCWYNIKNITCSTKGREKGLAIAECQQLSGKTFTARMTGDSNFRKFVYDNREMLMPGRALIEFSEFTDDGKPSHPRCLKIIKGAKVVKEEVKEV